MSEWGSADWQRTDWASPSREPSKPVPTRTAAQWSVEVARLEIVYSESVERLGIVQRKLRESPTDDLGHLDREVRKAAATAAELAEKLEQAREALATALAAMPQPSEEEVRELKLEVCLVVPDLLPGILVIEKLVALRKKAEVLLGEEHSLVADLPWDRLPDAARLISGFMESAGAHLTEEKR